jgi:hypothetical protein
MYVRAIARCGTSGFAFSRLLNRRAACGLVVAFTALSGGARAHAQVTVGGLITEHYTFQTAVTTLDSYAATSPGTIQRGITVDLPAGPFNPIGRRGSAISAGGRGFVSASSYAEYSNSLSNSGVGGYNLSAVADSQSIWNDFVVTGPAGGPSHVPFAARVFITGNATLNASPINNPTTRSWGLSAQANYGLVINDLVGINGSNFIVSIVDGGQPEYLSDGIFTNFNGALHTTSVSVMVPVNTPFSMRMFLQTRAGVNMPAQATGLLTSNIDFGHTASFESGGTLAPFILPDGYTVNSVSAGVVNNTYTVPAPGAAAVLGLSGLMAARRRR